MLAALNIFFHYLPYMQMMEKNIHLDKSYCECDFNCLTEVSLFENSLISKYSKYTKWVLRPSNCLSEISDFTNQNYTYIWIEYMSTC